MRDNFNEAMLILTAYFRFEWLLIPALNGGTKIHKIRLNILELIHPTRNNPAMIPKQPNEIRIIIIDIFGSGGLLLSVFTYL